MNVRSFKLVNDRELIAELVAETGMGYQVKNPLVVHVFKGPEGQGHLAFSKLSMIQADEELEIFDHALMARPARVLDEIERSYMEQVTGLALPTPPVSQILTG